MTPLDTAIAEAIAENGSAHKVNRVYLLLLKASLIVPIHKELPAGKASEAEPFVPLYIEHADQFYLLAFDTRNRYNAWAGEQAAEIDTVELTGEALIQGMGEHSCLCLNFGTAHYKEFPSAEVARLQTLIAKLAPYKQSAEKNY